MGMVQMYMLLIALLYGLATAAPSYNEALRRDSGCAPVTAYQSIQPVICKCGNENYYDMIHAQAEPCNPPGTWRGNEVPIAGLERVENIVVVFKDD